jgi:hypothetical protein
MTVYGPTLPTWALQQVVGYLRYTGRDANVVATDRTEMGPLTEEHRPRIRPPATQSTPPGLTLS